jgi:glycosyltransferase involved in cell wall biosynthesis
MILHYMRMWDQRTAAGVDDFIANSHFIGARITKAYRRESTVIYPPVDTRGFALQEEKQDYYFTASRMVPYKRMPMIIEAFAAMPGKRLVVIGDGPEMEKAKAAAANAPNVTLLGYQPFAVLQEHMSNAKAFVFAAEEDFGISPVEAQACGTPVIAFAKGGVVETVCGLDHPQPTGVLYPEQSVASLMAAIETFEINGSRITAQACRTNAERFSEARFELEMRQFVETRLSAARQSRQPAHIRPVQTAPTLVSNDLSARVVPIKSV